MLPAAAQCCHSSSAFDLPSPTSRRMEFDPDLRSPAGSPLPKLARTGDFSHLAPPRPIDAASSILFMGGGGGGAASASSAHHDEFRMLLHSLGGGGSGGSLVRSNCSGGGGGSSTDDAQHLQESNVIRSADTHLFLGAAARPDYSDATTTARSMFYHHHHHLNPLIAQTLYANSAGLGMEGRVVFTPGQLRELQHQALVLKYIMNGVNVPADLVNPIRSSIAGIPSSMAGFVNLAWGGGYRGGYGGNPDPEPGRCRRTDGKKWRCSRDVVPDQKYCERHIHRGRHRSRKPATPAESAAEQTRPSPAMAASSSPSTIALPATPSPPVGSHLYQRPHEPPHRQEQHQHEHHQFHSHHHHHPQQHQQQLSPNLGIKPYSATNSPSASGLSAGSTVSASQYNQMQQQQQLHPSSKDVRYVGGIGTDQIPFAETSGTSRGIGQDFQAINQQGGEVSMFSSMNSSWRNASMQQSRAPSPGHHPEPTKPSSHSMQYHSPQIRSLISQDFNLMSTEMNPLSLHNMAQQSQQHQHQHQHQYSFLGSGYGSVVEAVASVGREHESQPLRHFFDDWPRSKDASALSWSNVEDGKSNPNAAVTPHLLISTPVSTSDFNNAAGSPPGKSKVSSLKLSMWRAGEDEIPPGMELGVGVGLGMNEDRRQQHQANLLPLTWETPVGGPLAEAFQSSTPRESSSKTSGLNLMTQGWEGSPQESPQMSSSPARGSTESRTYREGLNARHGNSPGSMEASKRTD